MTDTEFIFAAIATAMLGVIGVTVCVTTVIRHLIRLRDTKSATLTWEGEQVSTRGLAAGDVSRLFNAMIEAHGVERLGGFGPSEVVQGPPGPMGPRGPQGEPGLVDTATLSNFEERLHQAHQDIAHLSQYVEHLNSRLASLETWRDSETAEDEKAAEAIGALIDTSDRSRRLGVAHYFIWWDSRVAKCACGMEVPHIPGVEGGELFRRHVKWVAEREEAQQAEPSPEDSQ